MTKGKEQYKNDQDEQAAETFKQVISRDPNNAEAHLRLGMSYAALDKKTESDDEYKKAIELFKKRIQADSKDGDAFFYLGEAHSFLHQDEEAARAYRQATKLKPEDEEAFYQLGMAETRLAHYPEAASAFQKALELDPNDYRATDALENAKEGTQRIKEGKKHAEEMLKKQQENANANGNLNSNSSSKTQTATRDPPPGVRRRNRDMVGTFSGDAHMATYTPPPYFPQSSLSPPDEKRYRKFKLMVASCGSFHRRGARRGHYRNCLSGQVAGPVNEKPQARLT